APLPRARASSPPRRRPAPAAFRKAHAGRARRLRRRSGDADSAASRCSRRRDPKAREDRGSRRKRAEWRIHARASRRWLPSAGRTPRLRSRSPGTREYDCGRSRRRSRPPEVFYLPSSIKPLLRDRSAQLPERRRRVAAVERQPLLPESYRQAGPRYRRVPVMDAVKIKMQKTGGECLRQRKVPRVESVADGRRVVIDVVEKGNQKGARAEGGREQRPVNAVAPRARGEKRDDHDSVDAHLTYRLVAHEPAHQVSRHGGARTIFRLHPAQHRARKEKHQRARELQQIKSAENVSEVAERGARPGPPLRRVDLGCLDERAVELVMEQMAQPQHEKRRAEKIR